jgi:hypothetical protein
VANHQVVSEPLKSSHLALSCQLLGQKQRDASQRRQVIIDAAAILSGSTEDVLKGVRTLHIAAANDF